MPATASQGRTSKRWLNLILWGLGDRLDGTNDYRSNILLLVDVLIWVGVISFLVQEPGLFIIFWALGPLTGQPVDIIFWVGTQVVVGYLMARNWKKQGTAMQVQPKPQSQGVSEPAVSEEP
jgi:hypothetical protein